MASDLKTARRWLALENDHGATSAPTYSSSFDPDAATRAIGLRRLRARDEDTDALNFLGIAAHHRGDGDEAMDFWTRSCKQGDDVAPLLVHLTTVREDNLVLIAADEEGTFILLGGDLPGYDVVPMPLLSEQDRRTLGDAVAGSMGVFNTAAQAARGISEARGLVRLAPETIELMKSGMQPLAKNGWNLGTLVADGKFTRQVRWLPAGSAGAVSILAAIGPAAALVAIQWQLAQMSRLIEKNIALTNTVLQVMRGQQWAEIRGQHDAILAELGHAQAIGAVTQSIWEHAQAQSSETNLRGNMLMFFEHVQGHERDLSALNGARPRRDWLVQNSEAVLRDVDALLMAHRAWFIYQSLRAGHLSESAAHEPRDLALQQKIVRDARNMHEQVLAACEPLLDSLYSHFRLMETCPGGMGLTISGRRSTPADVASAAANLADQIARLRGVEKQERPFLKAAFHLLPSDKNLDEVKMRLRWVLSPDERLEVVTWGWSGLGFNWQGFLVETDRRTLFLDEAPFLEEGDIQVSFDLSEITQLRWEHPQDEAGCSALIVDAGERYWLGLPDDYGTAKSKALMDKLKVVLEKSRTHPGRPKALAAP